MNQAAYLHRLQLIDTQIDQIDIRLAEIERLFLEDELVRAAKQGADDAKLRLEKTRLALRSIEHTVSETRVKIDLSNAALYGGTIRNPKELQDLQREIASLKGRLTNLEDAQLNAMIEQEEAESSEKAMQENLAWTQAQAVEKKAGLAGERNQLVKNRSRLETERSAAIPPILPQNLEIYNHLRQAKNGLAVSVVEDDTCRGCGSEVRPAEAQAARLSSSPLLCKFCGRILFAG